VKVCDPLKVRCPGTSSRKLFRLVGDTIWKMEREIKGSMELGSKVTRLSNFNPLGDCLLGKYFKKVQK
jgi:hypothetical protein